MGSEQQWHSANSTLNDQGIGPKLLPNESLSSWICRLALFWNLSPEQFTGVLQPKSRLWLSDVDRGLKHEILAELARISKTPIALLKGATIDLCATKWLPEDRHVRLSWPWVVPNRIRGGRRLGSWPFCSECWSEDEAPYYRINWRFSWTVACEIHNAFLIDRCQGCGVAVVSHRLQPGAHLALCDRCGFDLRKATPVRSENLDVIVSLQRSFDVTAISGRGAWWGQEISAAEWMATASFWLGFIRRGIRERSSSVRSFVKMLSDQEISPIAPLVFHQLPTADRAIVLTFLGKIMQNSLADVSGMLASSGVSRELLTSWLNEAPTAKHVIDQLEESVRSKRHRNRRKKNKYGLNRPRPRHEVRLMHRQFLQGD